jgi:hypothetical protein
MIGSGEIDIDGIKARRQPRAGDTQGRVGLSIGLRPEIIAGWSSVTDSR